MKTDALKTTAPSSSGATRTRGGGVSLTDAANGRGLVRSGQSGESVRELQTRLASLGYPVEADGKFGPATRRAVEAFQHANGCKVDGLVGPETMGALNGTSPRGPSDAPRDSFGDRAGHTDHRRVAQQSDLARSPEGTRKAGDLAREEDIRRTRAPEGRDAQGSRTIGGRSVTLAPSNASPEEQYQHYEGLIRAAGGELRPGERTVLALRGMDTSGDVGDTRARSSMQDTMVVLWRDSQGRAHVRHHEGSTYPGQRNSRSAPDRDGDGAGDVGMIREGNYRVTTNGNFHGRPSYRVKTLAGSGRIPGVRDMNHDGRHSPEEWARASRTNEYMTGILFHAGNGSRVSSIGCQNVKNWDGFVSDLGGPRANFNYTVINAGGPEPR